MSAVAMCEPLRFQLKNESPSTGAASKPARVLTASTTEANVPRPVESEGEGATETTGSKPKRRKTGTGEKQRKNKSLGCVRSIFIYA